MKSRASISAIAGTLLVAASFAARTSGEAPMPATLAGTGLYEPGSTQVRAAHEPFEPAYPLWTDAMGKRRWLYVPAGSRIDKSDPDAWDFPRGTRAWKEFRRGDTRVETRFIERLADGSWRFATYVWNAEGTEARLAPAAGLPERGIPSREDCLACHEGAPVPVLGYSAVQLERTVAGRTREEGAALGYLHGNCGHCHNESALGGTGLFLAQSAADPARSEALARASIAQRPADIARRLQSSNPYVRMPPFGVSIADAGGAAVIQRYLDTLDPPSRRAP